MNNHPTHATHTHLTCLRCGATYDPQEIDYLCPKHANHGSDVGSLDVGYDYARIGEILTLRKLVADPDRSIGRFWPLLPISARGSLPPLAVGGTPLTHAGRLGDSIGLTSLYLKDDGRNPSASLKDRASAVVVARAIERGDATVATASTGNAAAALAGQAAAAGIEAVIFVPRTAPPAKIAQLLVYGSRVLAIDGSYDTAFDLCSAACREFGWYNRNTGYNPYTTEGKKTVSYEISLQLTALLNAQNPDTVKREKLLAPDALFVSVGDGSIIGGVHKGFRDLLALGWIERLPRIYGVQSTRSAALAQAWQQGLTVPEPIHATTRADSINVDAPRDPIKALNAVRQTEGAFVVVDDEAILAAISPLARLGAVFAEPAGAAAYAGLLHAWRQGWVQADERIVAIITGNGLKDVPAAMEAAGGFDTIEPTLDAVRTALTSSSFAQ